MRSAIVTVFGINNSVLATASASGAGELKLR